MGPARSGWGSCGGWAGPGAAAWRTGQPSGGRGTCSAQVSRGSYLELSMSLRVFSQCPNIRGETSRMFVVTMSQCLTCVAAAAAVGSAAAAVD